MYFPLFVDLTKKRILVIGGGTIASRRVGTLCGFVGQITVAAPKISDKIKSLSKDYPITLIPSSFDPAMTDGADLVLAATDDPAVNRKIAEHCREKSIPVNNCSEKEDCDFYFPSIVKNDEIVIGINASGKNHRLVKETRIELEDFLKK